MRESPLMVSILVIVTTIFSTLAFAVALSSPQTDEIAALFPPWWPPARAFLAAGGVGDIVSVGLSSRIIIVHGDAVDLAARLRHAGALITLDARAFVACGIVSLEHSR